MKTIEIDLMAVVFYPTLAWATWKGWVPLATAAIILLGKIHLTMKWSVA